jgi:hypothetical protein
MIIEVFGHLKISVHLEKPRADYSAQLIRDLYESVLQLTDYLRLKFP